MRSPSWHTTTPPPVCLSLLLTVTGLFCTLLVTRVYLRHLLGRCHIHRRSPRPSSLTPTTDGAGQSFTQGPHSSGVVIMQTPAASTADGQPVSIISPIGTLALG